MMAQLYRALLTYAVIGLAIAAGLGFLAGNCHGRRGRELADVEAALRRNADSVRLSNRAREVAQREAALALREADVARARYQAARARVRVVDDSTVSVDEGPPTFVGIPVVSLLGEADERARRDSIARARLLADVAACDEQRRRDLERIRLLERQVALLEGGWCGERCHFVLGVLATTGVALVVEAIRGALQD